MTHRDDITEAVAGVYRLIHERLDQHGAPDGETVVERLETWAKREAELSRILAEHERSLARDVDDSA